MKLIIDIPNEGYDWIKNGFPDNEDKKYLIKAVKNGTPYEDRPQGEWIKQGIYFECPFCHCGCNSIIDRIVFGKLNYCPNCGAYMKGGAE